MLKLLNWLFQCVGLLFLSFNISLFVYQAGAINFDRALPVPKTLAVVLFNIVSKISIRNILIASKRTFIEGVGTNSVVICQR